MTEEIERMDGWIDRSIGWEEKKGLQWWQLLKCAKAANGNVRVCVQRKQIAAIKRLIGRVGDSFMKTAHGRFAQKMST